MFRHFNVFLPLFHFIPSILLFCSSSTVIIIIIILPKTRFVRPFSDLIHSWEKTLSLIYEIIDQWVNFTQRKWLYLEGIFVNNDARIKLPTIAAKFDLIDGEYIKVSTKMKKEINIESTNHKPFSGLLNFKLKDSMPFISFVSITLFTCTSAVDGIIILDIG